MNEKLLALLLHEVTRELWRSFYASRDALLARYPQDPIKTHLMIRCDYYQPIRGDFGENCPHSEHFTTEVNTIVSELNPIHEAIEHIEAIAESLETST